MSSTLFDGLGSANMDTIWFDGVKPVAAAAKSIVEGFQPLASVAEGIGKLVGMFA